jgi:HlyD family secretion protein
MDAHATQVVDAPDSPSERAARIGVSADLRSLQLNAGDRQRRGLRNTGFYGRYKWAVLAMLLVVVGAGGWLGYRGYVDSQVPHVDVAPVLSDCPREAVLDLAGTIEPRARVKIGPRVPGTIVELPIEEGSYVHKGDLVARIDDVNFMAEYKEAIALHAAARGRLEELENGALEDEIQQLRAQRDEASAQLDLAQKEFERAITLHQRKSIPDAEMDMRVANLKQAKSRLQSVEHQLALLEEGPREERIAVARAEVERTQAVLEQAKYFFDNTRIVAPISGTILEKEVEIGEIVRPEVMLTSLCVLADLSHLDATVDVQERDLYQVSVDQTCVVIPDAYRDRQYVARVDRIHPQINVQRGVAKVRVEIDEPDEFLLPNMNCRVLIYQNDAQSSPGWKWVPKSAVVEENGAQSVFILQDDRAQRQVVEVAENRGSYVAISSGLLQHQLVILPGATPVEDGALVQRKSDELSSASAN